ncbi:DEAD/DEAH box helicase family protein [Mycobacterium sp. SMC-4]|uniref:DEAD/DEAH box helicase family protein n=1 Tax=Mycobacterium sp. SMC-4 TaxID=2857059 RepID=UPI0021B19944|nr:DEAD/DEAH box helicase family protein [Mycobacterium sp. SMC-4]UXA18802.1 DEAD/DEAH box helicase family protein [Mycobacterium sp. SMC-4]
MSELNPGIYEALVTETLRARLVSLDSLFRPARPLHKAEAADRIALHLSRQIEQSLAAVSEDSRVRVGIEVAQALIARLAEFVNVDTSDTPTEPGEVLHAILEPRPDGTPRPITEPLIPLLDTTLLTNAPGEPGLLNQLDAEIDSADAIDVVMAFIRRSGINPLLGSLRRHCERGRPLRVLTTTYTGSTERAALDQLSGLGADVQISYDLSTTRLHAKSWIFHRRSGFSTAYVGSSNLTLSAQVTGLEWNIRASSARNPDILAKFEAVFESYWQGSDFVPYDPNEFDAELQRAGRIDTGPTVILSPVELRLEPFQERLLEQIELSRDRGHHRNLLVAATGTGKTVMAAVDYARLRAELPRSRLLFVAHRNEILDQSLATFRYALRDASFGEKWIGGSRPHHFEHVFASVQSLNAANLGDLPPDHFDVVIVDEFHHAAASSYRKLLDHLKPVELLGLTATPERSDDLSILHWFDDRIAAELRLWDAIDQQRLSPFMYFGIHDGLDLTQIPWRRGHGYDLEALSGLYTSTDAWARTVLQEVLRLSDDHSTMRGLGFCVSIDHAKFMAKHFNKAGVPAVAVWGDSPPADRRAALQDLAAGKIRVVFSVDLFNEGVDVPTVDTVLMLRPTESPTLFLQQLGRGLRRAKGKTFCTVLDFVGTHRREFRFDRRYRALIGGTRRDIERAVRQGFPFLPAGCYMHLDAKASEIVLRSLREAIPTRWPARVEELRIIHAKYPDVTLSKYLAESGLDLPDVYDGSRGWSDLCAAAGVPTQEAGVHEKPLRRALGRLLHIDDDERIATYRRLLESPTPVDVSGLSERERRLVRMLVASTVDQVLTKEASLQDGVDLLWAHPQVRAELVELLLELDDRVDHRHGALDRHPGVPLQVHARYTRIEILAAFGIGKGATVPSWREGVYEAKTANAELFAFTLDKSSGAFSPT